MLYLLKTLFFIEVLVATGLLVFRYALAPRHHALVSGKITILALLTPVVALFCGSINLFYLYLAAIVAFNSRSSTELAGVFLFLLPSMPVLVTVMNVGGLYLIDASVVPAMGLGALVGFLITRRTGLANVQRLDIAMWALVVLFTFINARNTSVTDVLRNVTVNLLTFAGPYLLVSRAVRSAADLERIWLRLLNGATVMAVTAIFQAKRDWVIFETYYQTLHVPLPITSAALYLRAGLLRTGGSMLDYSAGGLFLAAALSLLLLLRHSFRPRGFWLISGIVGGGLLASQSRGAWIAAACGIIFVAVLRGRWRQAAALAGSAGALSLLAIVGPFARFGGQAATDTADYRRQLAFRGIDVIRAHPLLGQPPQQLTASLADLQQGQHIVDFVNGHLFIAMAAGIPFFLVWCAVWLLPIIGLWRNRWQAPVVAGGSAVVLVPVLVALTFTSFVDRNLSWLAISLGLAAPSLSIGRLSRGQRPAGIVRASGSGRGEANPIIKPYATS